MNGCDGKCVLVTGGAGFIGSHSVVDLIEAGYKVVLIDNLSNSNVECIYRMEKISQQKIPFYKISLTDNVGLTNVFKQCKIDHVIHFSALKCVPESVEKPLIYYENNIGGLLSLLQVMNKFDVKNLIFSSSCTVYGQPQFLPLTEKHPVGNCVTPYGTTKYICEVILKDLCNSDPTWNIISLRYFNPIGAHSSGLIGEDPTGIPNNLMPYIAQVAIGRRPFVNIYGSDYETPDGTGIRDYIHVVDLANAHTKSLKLVENNCGYKIYNLGTGKGYSVLEMISAMEAASGRRIPYKICSRRPGDVATIYADATLVEEEMGWKAMFGIDQMCADLWNFQTKNPNGYGQS